MYSEERFKEFNISIGEQQRIMDIMEKYRTCITNKEEVSNGEFEKDIFSIFGGYEMAVEQHKPSIDHHFCQLITEDFMKDGRWEEVFPTLYGDCPECCGKINIE